MEQRGINCSGSGPLRLIQKPERKVAEKNRRNHMKFLYSHLFSLVPPHLISKGGDQVPDRMDRAIEYIQSLKASLEMSNNKKEKLLSIRNKRSYVNVTVCNPLDIQIHEISPDLDAVLVTGLTIHSNFLDVVRLLDQYSAEVALASFSSCGHATFHVCHKKIEAEEMCERIKILLGGSSISKTKNDLGDNYASSHSHRHNQSDSTDLSLSVWDFDFQSNVWGWELEAFPNAITG